jgi:hypothetical protein
MIHCTPSVANFVLLSVKDIFAVVSGVLLMQTSIFMVSGLLKKVVATTISATNITQAREICNAEH